MLDTGTLIIDSFGFKMPKALLDNWPDDDIKYLECGDEVGYIADQLISKFKSELSHINIAYLFKQKASKSGENLVLGTAGVTSQKVNALSKGVEAVIEIGFDQWTELSPDQKFRLVYHELCHLAENEKGKTVTVEHDITEFVEVMRAFGPATDAEVEYLAAYESWRKLHGISGTIKRTAKDILDELEDDDDDQDED